MGPQAVPARQQIAAVPWLEGSEGGGKTPGRGQSGILVVWGRVIPQVQAEWSAGGHVAVGKKGDRTEQGSLGCERQRTATSLAIRRCVDGKIGLLILCTGNFGEAFYSHYWLFYAASSLKEGAVSRVCCPWNAALGLFCVAAWDAEAACHSD